MKFYGREQEIEYLLKIGKLADKRTQLTVLTGRRRVGKTELIKQFLSKNKNKRSFYFFIARKKTKVLLSEFSAILSGQYPILTSKLTTWEQFFKFIFEISKQDKIIIVFDEFQNFKYVDSSVFSSLQKYIDEYKNKTKLNIIAIGSMFTLMEKIFYGSKEPLFGRCNHKMVLSPFSPDETRQILRDYKKREFIDLINFYTVFGGVPKYYNDIDNLGVFAKKFPDILKDLILDRNSLLKREGFDLIADEFGRNYQTYFSILQSIASGKTKTSEIANSTGIPVYTLSQYLEKLLVSYKLIKRNIPLLIPKTKNTRYSLNDPFLKFWFRYLYKNWSMVELNNFAPILKYIKKDINSLYGFGFETIIRKMITGGYIKNFPIKTISEVGSWWSRKDGEIDIVATNKEAQKIFFGECKLNNKQVNRQLGIKLKGKAKLVKWKNSSRKSFYGIFTVGKINKRLKDELLKEKIAVWEMG